MTAAEVYAFAECVPHVVWVARPDGSAEYVNRRWRDYTGMSLADVAARDWAETAHPDDRPAAAAAWEHALRTGGPFEVAFRFRRHDGAYRWHVSRGEAQLAGGAVVRVVGTCTDVDDGRRSEGLLSLQSRVLEAVALGVPLKDVLDQLAAGVEELADGLICSVLLLDADRLRDGAGPSLPAAFRAAVDGGRIGPTAGSCGTAAFRGEAVVVEDIAADPLWDAYRHLALPHGLRACWSTPVLGRDGRVLGTFALYHATPRGPRPDERALVATATHLAAVAIEQHRGAATRARVAAIVDSSDDAIIGLTAVGVVQTWNPGAERLYGYAAAEVVGRSVAFLLPPERASDLPDLTGRLARGEHVPPFETQRLRKDGTRVDVSLRLSPQCDAAGRLTGYSAIARDISDRKALEERLRVAAKMEAVGRLAGGVAHDFNNLLTVITGYVELVRARLPAGEPGRDMLDQVLRAGARAADLTRQLLAYGRKQILQPQVIDLGGLVTDLGGMLRRLIGEDVELVLAAEPVRATADPGQLGQVLMNLVVNARHALPRGGRVTVRTAAVDRDAGVAAGGAVVAPGRYALLEVADTGEGMTDEVKARAFEPFFTTKGVGQGTGLGLATVFGIVAQSGGHVELESAPGRGTAVRAYLPASAATAAPAPTPPPAAAPGGSGTILIVEDDDGVRALAARALRDAGYTVRAAATAEAALADAAGIDLLLTDVVLPGAGGRELADRLAAARPGLRVLYVSGYTDDAVLRHGVEQNAVHFLAKPFTPAGLTAKVREVFDAPGRSESNESAGGGCGRPAGGRAGSDVRAASGG